MNLSLYIGFVFDIDLKSPPVWRVSNFDLILSTWKTGATGYFHGINHSLPSETRKFRWVLSVESNFL